MLRKISGGIYTKLLKGVIGFGEEVGRILLTQIQMCIRAVYSFSSLRSLALGLVTLMASWAALSTTALQLLEETL